MKRELSMGKDSVFKYPNSFIVMFGTLVCQYVWYIMFPMFSHSHILSLVMWPIMWLTYPLFHNSIGSILSCYASHTALVSSDSKSTSPLMRSITPSPLFLSLSSKTSCISKSSIRGVVFLVSIWWSSSLIMPPIRSSASDQCNRLVTVIFSLSEVMPSCSHCEEKKLVYVAIVVFTGCQPSLCVKCIQVNMWLSCNV